MDDMDKSLRNYMILAGVVVVITIIGVLAAPWFEMNTFNKFSDQKATYIDALCTQLRVIPN